MTDGAGHPVSGAGRVILPPVLRSGVATGAGVRLVTDHPALDVAGGRIAGRAADPVTAVIQVVPAAADGRSAEPEAFAVTVLPAAAPALLAGTRRPDLRNMHRIQNR